MPPAVYTTATVYYRMSISFLRTEAHEQSYLKGELESLGLCSMQLNEFNDNVELRSLIIGIKEGLLQQYNQAHQEASPQGKYYNNYSQRLFFLFFSLYLNAEQGIDLMYHKDFSYDATSP